MPTPQPPPLGLYLSARIHNHPLVHLVGIVKLSLFRIPGPCTLQPREGLPLPTPHSGLEGSIIRGGQVRWDTRRVIDALIGFKICPENPG